MPTGSWERRLHGSKSAQHKLICRNISPAVLADPFLRICLEVQGGSHLGSGKCTFVDVRIPLSRVRGDFRGLCCGPDAVQSDGQAVGAAVRLRIEVLWSVGCGARLGRALKRLRGPATHRHRHGGTCRGPGRLRRRRPRTLKPLAPASRAGQRRQGDRSPPGCAGRKPNVTEEGFSVSLWLRDGNDCVAAATHA